MLGADRPRAGRRPGCTRRPAGGSSPARGTCSCEALVACAGVTLRSVATSLGDPGRAARVRAEGDLDFRGTLGVASATRRRWASARSGSRFDLHGDATEEQLATLLRLTERYCVVYQTLAGGVPSDVAREPDRLATRAARPGRHRRAPGRPGWPGSAAVVRPGECVRAVADLLTASVYIAISRPTPSPGHRRARRRSSRR